MANRVSQASCDALPCYGCIDDAITITVDAMLSLIKLAIARELAALGSLRGASVLGCDGGFVLHLHTDADTRVLATKQGQARVFARLANAVSLLDGLGITAFDVDTAAHVPAAPRQRPDRAHAMQVREQRAQYGAYVYQRAQAALAHAGGADASGLSDEEAQRERELDLAYEQMLRDAWDEAEADPRPPLSSEEVKRHLDVVKREYMAKLEQEFGRIAA